MQRVLALDQRTAEDHLADLESRFASRHRNLQATFRHHAERIQNRVRPGTEISDAHWLLLGATFTHEYSIEAASLCNPSVVAHPDQSAATPGSLRFVLSARGIGEGHLSSIEFREGTVTADGSVTLDPPGPYATNGTLEAGRFEREVFHRRLQAVGTDGESAAFVLDSLGASFTTDELETRLSMLASQADTRRNASVTVEQLREIAACSYSVVFPPETALAERVLSPTMPEESHGMEDARFVRFVDDDGAATYMASYTAFDGASVSQQLLRTTDFRMFQSSPISGVAALNKGLALFPRRIAGRFVAMTRHDRETNAVAFSSSPSHWEKPSVCQRPQQDWELIQLGNCGSPIETDEGWLVLTHGVGPMRTYSIGAVLLDLDDPTRLLASLATPLITSTSTEQDGYVPNVVYSCGGLIHNGTLVIPFGVADTSIAIATVARSEVIDAMVRVR